MEMSNMSVNNVGQASLTLPITNNVTTQINKTQNSQEQLQGEIKKVAQDIYHKVEEQDPVSVYDKMVITTETKKAGINYGETLEEANKRFATMAENIYIGTVPDITRKMVEPYEQFMSELANETPELAEKSFGVSINAKGELEASGDHLSADEKSLLNTKLNEDEKFVKLAQSFKDNFLEYVHLDSQAWGKYDITEDNFAEVFDFKSLLGSVKDDILLSNEGGLLPQYMSNMSSQMKRNAELKP